MNFRTRNLDWAETSQAVIGVYVFTVVVVALLFYDKTSVFLCIYAGSYIESEWRFDHVWYVACFSWSSGTLSGTLCRWHAYSFSIYADKYLHWWLCFGNKITSVKFRRFPSLYAICTVNKNVTRELHRLHACVKLTVKLMEAFLDSNNITLNLLLGLLGYQGNAKHVKYFIPAALATPYIKRWFTYAG